MTEIVIREATLEDAIDVMELGRGMHRHSSFAPLRYDGHQVLDFLDRLILSPGHAVFVARDREQLVGFVLASTHQSFFGPDKVASEHAFFVHPDYRGGGAAKQLVNAYEDWAVRNGAKRINMGNSAGTADEPYVRLLESEGFTRPGSLLYKNV